jgi:dienelactone hydrolase
MGCCRQPRIACTLVASVSHASRSVIGRPTHRERRVTSGWLRRLLTAGTLVALSVGIGAAAGAANTATATAATASSGSLAVGTPIRVTGAGGESHFAVGFHVETLVDPGRSTPTNGTAAGHPGRTLETFILYPASSPSPKAGVGGTAVRLDAAPQRSAGTFPLIVFAHGFGTDPNLSEYSALLEQWAAAGYVVAAPLFPLTRADAPGSPDLADYVNQPGDMAFVANQVVAQSQADTGILSGLVNTGEIGAAGHSLGGVTTLGLVANSCCRDTQIKAAVVISGDPIKFPTGAVNYRTAPPLLLVHGNADQAVPYVSSIDAFNGASAPKGLLTVEGGNHDSPVTPTDTAFPSVVRTTIDFFDRYLKGEKPAAGRLVTTGGSGSQPADSQAKATKLIFVATPGTKATLPVPKTVKRTLKAMVTPTQGLADGQSVTISWEGFAPGVAVNILQCSVSPPTMASDCNLNTAAVLHPDPQGSGSFQFVVHTGPSGTGTCDATHAGCVVVINQGGSLSPAAIVTTPISFAP